MAKNKDANKERVKRWRERLKQREGRTITVDLEKDAVQRFERLRRQYNEMTVGELIGLALGALEQHTNRVRARKTAESGTSEGDDP